MTPGIHEIFVLTFYNNDSHATELRNDDVYLDKVKAVKAKCYQNGKNKALKAAGKPTITYEVMNVEQYVRKREHEAYHRGEIHGEFPNNF